MKKLRLTISPASQSIAGEIVERESKKFKRWIKESIHIRMNSPTMNRDEGAYQLTPIWNQLIPTPNQEGRGGGGGSRQSDFYIINTCRSLFKDPDTFCFS